MFCCGIRRRCFNYVQYLAYERVLASMCIVLPIFVFAMAVTEFGKNAFIEKSRVVDHDSSPVFGQDFPSGVGQDYPADVSQDIPADDGQEIQRVFSQYPTTVNGHDFTPGDGRDFPPVIGQDFSPGDGRDFPPVDVKDFPLVIGQDIKMEDEEANLSIINMEKSVTKVGQDLTPDVGKNFTSIAGQKRGEKAEAEADPSIRNIIIKKKIGKGTQGKETEKVFSLEVGTDYPPVIVKKREETVADLSIQKINKTVRKGKEIKKDFPSVDGQDYSPIVDKDITPVLGKKMGEKEAEPSIQNIDKRVRKGTQAKEIENKFPSVVGQVYSPIVGKDITPVVGKKMEEKEVDLSIMKIDKEVRKVFTARGLNKIRDLGRYDLLDQQGCKKRLPEALIIGIMKGGTEAFSTFLALNTKVAMSLNTATTMFFTSNYNRGPSWYRDQMVCSTGDQITIEKAPQYMPAPSAPMRVYRMNPDMKLIVLVRDPIARAVSHYLQMQHAHPGLIGGRSFEQHVFDANGNVNGQSPFIELSRYASLLQNWLEYFHKKQIHIVDGDRFKDHQVEVLAETEDFLGIERQITADRFIFNEEKGFYCLKSLQGDEICLGDGKGRTHPPLKSSDYHKLREYFRPYNERFFQQFDKRYNW